MDGSEFKVLVVDDEAAIADLVELYLKSENYCVYKFYSPLLALECVKQQHIDKGEGTAQGGAGLGLAIAKEIVERHGGNIQAESTVDFTEFAVRLPIGRS